jgi:hypothetical protein
MLYDLNRYLLYLPEETPKQIYQDEIIENLGQANARNPECHEAIVNANIEIFKMSYDVAVRRGRLNPSSLLKLT